MLAKGGGIAAGIGFVMRTALEAVEKKKLRQLQFGRECLRKGVGMSAGICFVGTTGQAALTGVCSRAQTVYGEFVAQQGGSVFGIP